MQALRHLMVFLMVLMLAMPVLSHAAMSADCHEPTRPMHTAAMQTTVIHSDVHGTGDLCCIAATCQICAPGQAVAAFAFASPVLRSHFPIGLVRLAPARSPEPADQPPRRA